jgi:thioredoxin reductase (NADPH)
MTTLYDLIIIGLGPASLTAQVYALRYNMKVLAIGGVPGGLMMESHKICNWPGEPGISGADLTKKMTDQLAGMNAETVIEEVKSITGQKGAFTVTTRSDKSFEAKLVLIATGTKHSHLGLAREDFFYGRGVTYCATCDAMFYKGKTTAVAGGGNSAVTAALYLSDICPRVYLIYRGSELKGETAWINELKAKDNVTLISETNIIDLKGENKLESVVLDKAFEGSAELAVSGLFVEIGAKPRNELFVAMGGVVDDFGFVKVASDMTTNLPGVFAAGDLTNQSNYFRQIATAVGEGSIAADSAFKALKS